jgi:hypothetical protein
MPEQESSNMASMARSLHIGVLKPHGVTLEDEVGRSAVADAELMAAIARDHGFPDPVLCTAAAETTTLNIAKEIAAAATDLAAGGIFLLTFSGHGYAVEAGGGPAAMSQGWVLSDADMFDQDLFLLFYQFEPGVRILVISDSCHSGTVVAPPGVLGIVSALFTATGRNIRNFLGQRSRFLSQAQIAELRRLGQGAFAESTTLLARVQTTHGALAVHVILLAACQDSQEAFVEDGHGLFTAKLNEELGTLNGHSVSYEAFLEGIKRRIPSGRPQEPNFFALPPGSPPFLAGPPFQV